MRVLGLAGSPRRGGNTETLLDEALRGSSQAGAITSKLVLNELSVRGCQHCDGCLETGQCVLEDDMGTVYSKLGEADHLILASPLFFMGITAQAKTVIDRCQALWIAKYHLGHVRHRTREGGRRRAAFICVGGMSLSDPFSGAIRTARSFFVTCGFTYAGALTLSGLDEKGAAEANAEALSLAFALGRRLVEEDTQL